MGICLVICICLCMRLPFSLNCVCISVFKVAKGGDACGMIQL